MLHPRQFPMQPGASPPAPAHSPIPLAVTASKYVSMKRLHVMWRCKSPFRHHWARPYAVSPVVAIRCSAASAAESQTFPAPSRPNQAAPPKSKQTLDYTALVACYHELRGDWVPSKVEEVVQPDRYTLSLRLRTTLSQGWLHLSWHPTAARVCTGDPPLRGAVSEVYPFVSQVSASLKGLVLTGASMPLEWERVLQLDFATRPSEPPARRLLCEVMGKYSNVLVTNGTGELLHCAYQVGSKMSSMRQLQVGRPYQLPPPAPGVAPNSTLDLATWRPVITQAAQLAAAPQDAAPPPLSSSSSSRRGTGSRGQRAPTFMSGCVRAFTGVSPSLVVELCSRAGVDPEAPVAEVEEQQWEQLHSAWQAWLDRLREGHFTATTCGATSRFSVLGSYPDPHPSVHVMLDCYYSTLQASELHASLHASLSAAVKAALKKARGKVISFHQQLKSAQGVDAVQKRADIIMANVYRIPPGSSSFEAEDWDTGATVSIALDPEQTPVEVAEGLYRRARKLRRAQAALNPLLEGAEGEVAYLDQLEGDLEGLGVYQEEADLAAVREVQEELVEARLIKPPPDAALAAKAAAKSNKLRKKQKTTARRKQGSTGGAAAGAGGGAAGSANGFRSYTSPGGLQVLVGRNNKQNDVLSHQVANPWDLWMHVRGMPGSHAVLRLPKKGESPEDEDVQFAADLTAFYSKARDSSKVDVIVTHAEHIKKIKGGKPGQVIVVKESWRSMVGRPPESAAAAAAGAA